MEQQNGGAAGRCHDPGYVYVMKDKKDAAYKIGCSGDPVTRLRQIRRDYPNNTIEILGYFPAKEMNRAVMAAQNAVVQLRLEKDTYRGNATDWFKDPHYRWMSVILRTVKQAVQ